MYFYLCIFFKPISCTIWFNRRHCCLLLILYYPAMYSPYERQKHTRDHTSSPSPLFPYNYFPTFNGVSRLVRRIKIFKSKINNNFLFTAVGFLIDSPPVPQCWTVVGSLLRARPKTRPNTITAQGKTNEQV